MNEVTEKKKWFERVKMPHTYVILITILVIMTVLTHIIPAGQYQRVEDPVSGKMIVVPGSFEFVDIKAPGFFDIFLSLQRGYVDAANIMFLIIFAYGFVYMLVKNGTMDAALGTLVRLVGKKVQLMIPITMIVLGALSSTLGIFEEVYGLFPVFVGISVALGYDIVVGGAIVCLGVIIGYASGTFNPYTIGIAQDVAGVEMFSGLGLRVVILVVFELAAILYIMNYARKVKADPTKSIMYGVESEFVQRKSLDELTGAKMNTRQKICLLIFFATLGSLLYGTTQLGWNIDEIAAMFLMMMIFAGIASGYSATDICKTFIESTKAMVSSMLIVGFTRGILIVMKDGMISDTIVYYLVSLLSGASKYVSAYGMLFLQNIIKFFITGSSSQATITMPIMAPTAELIGLSKQIAVLAYQFGNGFADMFWPTSCALYCGLMGVPLNKWYKFITPFFGIVLVLEVIFMTIAVAIGYC
ncbi:MAG: YfcC family protein [[Clostridium] symbiosum]